MRRTFIVKPKQNIKASIYSNNYDWMVGVYWSVDWHDFTITKVDNSLSICKVLESWISEDTGKDCENESTFIITSDKSGYLYIYSKKYPEFKLYLNSALNYDSKVPEDQNELAFLNEDSKDEDSLYDYEDDYTPSSTFGDYSPSNPWDAPGMSIRDFI